VTWVKWKLILVHLEIVLVLAQDRCTDWDEHAIGSEIILETNDGTPRWHGSNGILFWSLWRLC
jgi:hypothetical protein